ncbi:hypothetical protein F751_2235 [Auxenochlorella protothecoides]|uniref:Uncharacterized protein n=1 Tax=Auxenochlorella protothecoides TaxID=3075 RepID=A0A087SLP4_AUXPR|nr:hypothetical protein F751_2235 [Auxenochlorella protothecoides]KFM26648.1 hypothetical protein F751_2235 [Auxenochlorella protothecoides]RMZ56094.1 hypothetical protein APUTEX25_004518 [Auxenochlorella protothecoides]|eukprot:RMZ56094.1 hypothetical protein APUTEX25_004518 [Auxenochlorella protothecoides]
MSTFTGLSDQPPDVILVLVLHLASDPDRRLRDVINLAFASKSLLSSVTGLDVFWTNWSRTVFGRPRETETVLPLWSGWSYFSGRMRRRFHLCRAMHALLFRHPAPTYLMSGHDIPTLLAAEAGHGVELPECLWDLWRVYDGHSNKSSRGIFQGAHMLRLQEALERLSSHRPGPCMGGPPGTDMEPGPLMPFTTGPPYYPCGFYTADPQGRVWLTSSKVSWYVADTLTEMVRLAMTGELAEKRGIVLAASTPVTG